MRRRYWPMSALPEQQPGASFSPGFAGPSGGVRQATTPRRLGVAKGIVTRQGGVEDKRIVCADGGPGDAYSGKRNDLCGHRQLPTVVAASAWQ